ncbi:MAG: sigma-70 family RNA polymerase sigma factor [Sedimentisphaerales bacterium]|nr:sigma-70 family RNA polymerase sigma factor [Sedimentisphaerales bacterium]
MLEDRKLLWRLKHGDRDALRQIYEQYESDLVTLAANLLHDPATAQDVVQDVFIGLVRAVPGLRLRRTLRAYLATAVANRVRDHYRRKPREQTVSLDDASHVPAGGEGPVQMVIDDEQLRRLRAAVDELPYEQREVILLRVQTGLRFREIAKHQNVSIKTALSRYQYGLDKLRSRMNGEVPR